MPTLTLPYKTDPSAGPISAQVHYASSSSSSSSSPKPIVLLFHAGGFAAGSTAMIPPAQIAHLTTALHAIAAVPEYRLCPQVSLRDGPVADARACLAWARATLPDALRERTDGAVRADGARVAAVGYSAGGLLALELGNAPNPPQAILDFYGVKFLADPFWRAPFPGFAAVPDPDPAFVAQVHDRAAAVPLAAPPMFADGKPDLKTPRSAWMIHAIKHGELYAKCLRGPSSVASAGGDEGELEGLAAEVEPTRGFGKGAWPPTCFVHGTEDVFAPLALAARAAEEVREGGGVAELIQVEGVGHVFDVGLGEGDELFEGPVKRALGWLVERV